MTAPFKRSGWGNCRRKNCTGAAWCESPDEYGRTLCTKCEIAAEQRWLNETIQPAINERFATSDFDEDIPFDTNEPTNGDTMTTKKRAPKKTQRKKTTARRTKPPVEKVSGKLLDAAEIQGAQDAMLRRALSSTEGHEKRLLKIQSLRHWRIWPNGPMRTRTSIRSASFGRCWITPKK